MIELHLLPVADRESFFDASVAQSGIPFEIIEKDFWVVWILERLFSLTDLKEHLTFKGGTSLSKVYNIIQRFSEDIDLSIKKDFFGFNHVNDPEKAISKKKQRKILENLSAMCSSYVQNELLDTLKIAILEKFRTMDGWYLKVDISDPDGQTLQFEYPSTSIKDTYIRPSVKIELGARSEHWPVSQHKIQSYAKYLLKDKVSEPEIWVQVLNAKRTFWEKATILHQYAHLPEHKKLPPRISRHYYDFFCLLNSNIKAEAICEPTLLDRVAEHKRIYFASSWANYNQAQKGSIRLSPPLPLLEDLEKDFNLMKDMFFGPIPDWVAIVNTIKEFEVEFNDGPA